VIAIKATRQIIRIDLVVQPIVAVVGGACKVVKQPESRPADIANGSVYFGSWTDPGADTIEKSTVPAPSLPASRRVGSGIMAQDGARAPI
jgi:hypothetical protein